MPKLHNKSSKPDNILEKEMKLADKCIALEKKMPFFLKDYFIYLKSAVALSSRLAYLEDTAYFLQYLISEDSRFEKFTDIRDIDSESFSLLKSRDINRYIGDYCTSYHKKIHQQDYIFQNDNRSLARKKSSLSSLFKYLHRNEQLAENITDGFNPIKLPKPQPDAIKKLDEEEVRLLLEIVSTGRGLTDREMKYWKKTKKRDKALILFFVTYGLRLSEIQQLNLSSFNYSRNEFIIYRKRGKESVMPLNQTTKNALLDYIENERAKDSILDKQQEDALFLSMQNKRMEMKSIRELVKKYTSIAMGTGRKSGYSPHKLRATAASNLIERGFSIYDVQSLLDHDNVTTTQLYSAHRKNLKKEIIEKFEWSEEENPEKK